MHYRSAHHPSDAPIDFILNEKEAHSVLFQSIVQLLYVQVTDVSLPGREIQIPVWQTGRKWLRCRHGSDFGVTYELSIVG